MDDKPSWSLLELPTELLVKIVSCCYRQDRQNRSRMSALVARDVDSGIISPWETKGGSLANFSLTCKRVRALCCPHLFSVRSSVLFTLRAMLDHHPTTSMSPLYPASNGNFVVESPSHCPLISADSNSNLQMNCSARPKSTLTS